MTLGERIARRRRELGINQTELARKVSVSRQAVSQWESGQIRDIKGQHIATLAKVLRCDSRWLIGGKQAPDGRAPSEMPDNGLVRRIQFLTQEERERVARLLDEMEDQQRELYLKLKERFENSA